MRGVSGRIPSSRRVLQGDVAVREREDAVVAEGHAKDGRDKTLTAKKNFVWTCNKDTKEQVFNDGNVVAIMRITDLKA